MEGNLISKLVLLLLAACLARAAAQPLGCSADYQCDGYCDEEAKICRLCVKCEDFKRSPPATDSKCIKSVVDCGACFEGLVENVQGDLYAQCTPAGEGWPTYLWVALGVAGVVIIIVVLVFYLLRHTDIRILASTDTSVQSGCANGAVPSAPERPPDYNTLYSPERPESPPVHPHFTEEEATRPFIKPPPPIPARESAGNQAANFYNNPNYVRGPHLPSNYHTAEREPETTPEYLQDETTAESPWTPADSDNAPADSSSSSRSGSSSSSAAAAAPATSFSGALAAERGTALIRPPRHDAPTPSKQPRLRQDTNNNRNNRDSEEEPMSRPFGGPTINILFNVQQVNDVKL